MIDYPLPLIGFSAFSGTGKTTLLKRLLPILRQRGLRIAVIKHAHHLFEIDQPGKDSHELRTAGANQTLVASRRRMALVTEFEQGHPEPTLNELLSALDPNGLDLVLVEGFKHTAFPKIELHRPALGKPLLCLRDPQIIAIATDGDIPAAPDALPRLDLNDSDEIVRFIQTHMMTMKGETRSDPTHPEHRRQLC
ncbi:MAG: molybdopterin-guanine dinucleotide biosynthesis protein B [Candidatus Thiodiazotropha sp.]|jgi:molybdopterin-guanine dinucleotide biosynthesis protein MobB